MTISFIWFDLGYTLVYQEREAVFQRFLLEEGIELDLERIELAYHLTDKLFMREYPGVLGREPGTFFPWYMGVLNHSLGLHFDLSRQCIRLRELQGPRDRSWQAFPEAVSVLRELKSHSLGVGLISNWDISARDVLANTGLLPLLDPIIISSEVGIAKPDPAIFELALERAGVPPEECLYVGDNYYDDVIGSERVGMKSCLINRFGREGIQEIGSGAILASIQDLQVHLGTSHTGTYSSMRKGRSGR
ncbi:HAD family hydrolase [Paenibacillus filicis]|uniref:HAD family hydrolase n=1 Tax=Paenibacillus filicis TaxID=669464 RepID=A0ABU9DKJ7_9BACL